MSAFAPCPSGPAGQHAWKEQPTQAGPGHWSTFVCWACQTIIKLSLKDKRETFLAQQNQPVREG